MAQVYVGIIDPMTCFLANDEGGKKNYGRRFGPEQVLCVFFGLDHSFYSTRLLFHAILAQP